MLYVIAALVKSLIISVQNLISPRARTLINITAQALNLKYLVLATAVNMILYDWISGCMSTTL